MDNFLFLPRSLAAAVVDLSFAIAAGLIISGAWLPPGFGEKAGHKSRTAACLWALLAGLSAQAVLTTASMTGSSQFSVLCSQIVDVITGTHAGRILVWAAAYTILLLVLLIGRPRPPRRAALLAVLALLAAARAASGHPAAEGDFALPEFVQFLHLASISIWSGGVTAAGLFVLPDMMRADRLDCMLAFVRRLSRLCTIALLLVVLTGIYNSYHGLGGTAGPLIGTQWGYLLDAKIILVCAAIALGAYNRRLIGDKSSLSPAQATKLTYTLKAEAGVMVIILTLSAFLANSPPPGSG